jgi:hypothetical protein
MKRHFKFIGGPWDGEYHEVDNHPCDIFVWVHTKKSFKIEPLEETVLDEERNPIFDTFGQPTMRIRPPNMKITRYTLRHFAGEAGNVYWYAPDGWSDIYTLSQLVHHYPGRP